MTSAISLVIRNSSVWYYGILAAVAFLAAAVLYWAMARRR